ncbi:MAG: nucleotide pyrophosphatase [Candidatus Eisenbacteria bacterium]|nr:nucleotide pyrophosphatase [Candidatus Eisenbacteria bacterium]
MNRSSPAAMIEVLNRSRARDIRDGKGRSALTESRMRRVALAAAAAAAVMYPVAAHAYVGPGAGFAVVGSLAVVFITFFLALGSLISWPFRALRRAIKARHLRGPAEIKRAVVLGLDGLDPVLVRKYMDEGKLPNFKKLAEEGDFKPLGTSNPSMSPVAWSTFATGVDASRHNIFDFLGRDEKTYFPILSSTRIENPTRTLKLGRYRIPLGKPSIRLMRKSRAFWSVLDDCFVPCHVLRVPITFPPEKLRNGVMLSAMCVPDLRGSQGSFTYFTTDREKAGSYTGGTLILVEDRDGIIEGELPGPPDPFSEEHEELTVPFTADIDRFSGFVTIDFDGTEVTLGPREYSDWIQLEFKAGLGVKVKGIVRLYVNSIDPEFELYVTPINIDPGSPAMPVSEPSMFAQYLAKLQGPYATLGLAEDTWALNERMIDEEAFLEQTWLIHEEREKMFFNSLRKNRSGLTAVVFDATDRIQHMFMRYLDPTNPSNRDKDTEKHARAIEELYVRMDDLLARVRAELDDRTLLFVISDHGFKQFKYGVNLNTWALENGYMFPEEGSGDPAGEACSFGGYCAPGEGESVIGEYLQGVDWSRTKMYQLGLTGIYLNRKGREAGGILKTDEYKALKRELKEKIESIRHPETGEVAITAVYDTDEVMNGPYTGDAPDLIIGYNVGYRASWDAAVGKSGATVVEDNVKSWSGDHCIDYSLVPGVVFCNRKIESDRPGLIDIGPSILKLFGVKIPEYMQGKSIFAREAGRTGTAGGRDAAAESDTPDESGAAGGRDAAAESDTADERGAASGRDAAADERGDDDRPAKSSRRTGGGR